MNTPVPTPVPTPAPAQEQDALAPLLLNVEQTAQLLNLSPQTLFNWISLGRLELPSVKLGGRRLFRRSDVEDFVRGLHAEVAAPSREPAPAPVCASLAPAANAPRRSGRPRKSTALPGRLGAR